MTLFEPDQVDAAAASGRAALIRTALEPDWAHVWTHTPQGVFEPVADFHLTCGRAKAFTQQQADGTTRHVCRACAIDEATTATNAPTD